jgi:hypothetical protein
MGKDETKKVHVVCPICRARADIPVPTYIFHRNENGIANIQIQTNDVCEHQFLLAIDQNFNVRGTEKIDFQVTVAPQRENVTELTFGDVLSRFKSYATTCLLHALIFDYPIQIVTSLADQPTLYQQLQTLFQNILPADWQGGLEVTQISKKDFQNLRKTPGDTFVVDTKGIAIHTPWTSEKMLFEENLIAGATAANASEAQLAVVKQGIQNLYTFTQAAAELVRGKDLVFDNEMERFIETKAPLKKSTGSLPYVLKLFERRCADGKCLCGKVHLKSVDIMTKTFWS